MSGWLEPYRKDPASAWAVFEPSADRPWNTAAVAHLHRRAAFGAGPERLAADTKITPAQAVDRLIQGDEAAADGTSAADFARFFDRTEARLGPDGPLRRIQALWLQRMVNTPWPALEALTLFWHDHFATSQVKVQNTGLMVTQIATLRKHAFGPFASMLDAVAKDPAMLVWLDAAANRRSRPNENFAREVMELFTLGRGNYSEKDIQEAARAYTGWFVVQDRFSFLSTQHDTGEKTVLGKTGPFGGEDVHRVLLEQPANGMFLARKLVRYYVSETDKFDDLLRPLAESFQNSGGRTETLVRTILASRLFHDPAARRRRVKSPVAYVVGTCRMLGMADPMPPPELLADATSAMGQGLYAPPSVAGWEGGASWIDTTRLVARTNLALGICSGSGPLSGKLNTENWAKLAGTTKPADTATALAETLLADGADTDLIQTIRTQAEEASGDSKPVIARILTEPVYQLA
jgi:uncharacterized protein (DUF1800 family)